MTVVGTLSALAWIGASVFLYVHARSPWRRRPAGVAVMVMAVVTWLALTLAMLRNTFGIVLPDWLRAGVFLLIVAGVWWKAITAARYRYGDLHESHRSEEIR